MRIYEDNKLKLCPSPVRHSNFRSHCNNEVAGQRKAVLWGTYVYIFNIILSFYTLTSFIGCSED
jgi:hypothetical protein